MKLKQCVVSMSLAAALLPLPAGASIFGKKSHPNPPLHYAVKDGVLISGEQGDIDASRVQPVKLKHFVMPIYLPECQTKVLTFLDMVVGTDGKASHVTVLRSPAPSCSASAIQSLEKDVFSPATLDGKVIPMDVKMEIQFSVFP